MADAAIADASLGLEAALVAVVGRAHVLTDEASRELSGLDVRWRAKFASRMVVRPGSIDELCRVVALATAAGHALFPRGGALSYTRGYLPTRAEAITLDTARLDRIVAIDRENMFVTVEAGVTWAQLHAALAGSGVRPAMWGTLSGIRATIGGGMSQNSIFFGSGTGGITADGVLSLGVVLADGRRLDTGSAAIPGNAPFFRWNGPDLTGLFLGDSGAMGIKATVTLRLVPCAGATGFVSYAFPDHAALLTAMRAVARAGLASECFAFDPGLNAQEAADGDLAGDLRALAAVARKGVRGLWHAARIALAGRRVFGHGRWALHCAIEADDSRALRRRQRQVADIARAAGGEAIAASVPRIMHAAPFQPPASILGTRGERWVAIHGVLPPNRATAAMTDLAALRDSLRGDLERHGITTGTLAVAISTHAITIEAVCWWPEARTAFHEATLDASYLRGLDRFPPAPEATALVDRLHRETIALFCRHGAVFMQIGKYYPWLERLSPEARALVESLATAVDPAGLINPGSLGLGA